MIESEFDGSSQNYEFLPYQSLDVGKSFGKPVLKKTLSRNTQESNLEYHSKHPINYVIKGKPNLNPLYTKISNRSLTL